jgi:hypothetical protein
MTLIVFLYLKKIKIDEFVAISHIPACILNQTAHSNAICTVGTEPTEAFRQTPSVLHARLIRTLLCHDFTFMILSQKHGCRYNGSQSQSQL